MCIRDSPPRARSLPLSQVQHFGGGGCDDRGDVGYSDGTYTPEAYRNASRTRACAACAAPPPEVAAAEDALAGLVAVVPNTPLRSAGRAHPLLFSPGDCSHFCQPGPQNALAVALVQIIAEYGNASEFERRVTRSAFWQERWKARGAP